MKYRDNRSRRIFDFICRYTAEYGFPPTLSEMARNEGFRSNSGVIRHLDKLEKWGWIERYHGHARSIRILRRCGEGARETVAPGFAQRGGDQRFNSDSQSSFRR